MMNKSTVLTLIFFLFLIINISLFSQDHPDPPGTPIQSTIVFQSLTTSRSYGSDSITSSISLWDHPGILRLTCSYLYREQETTPDEESKTSA